MAWRVAESLLALRTQVNEKFPKRAKGSDGTIGDEAHASRSSDHNPWIKDGKFGVVSGMDITHDPKNGVDIQRLADQLVTSRDRRIKYIICNGRIISSETSPWVWRKYTGSNRHDHHIHISVKSDKKLYDDKAPWEIPILGKVPTSSSKGEKL